MDRIILNEQQLRNKLRRKISFLANWPFIFNMYRKRTGYLSEKDYNTEIKIPGRMYSYIVAKP